MSDRNVKTVREACEHGRYERHDVWTGDWEIRSRPPGVPFLLVTPVWCNPWGEGKNTLQLDRMVNLRPMKSKWIRWVSEWEPADV